MSRRSNRRSGRGGQSRPRRDPFAELGADRAWRADDAVDSGSKTTSIPSYIGPSLSLAAFGTGQAIKAASAAFPGRQSITCDGLAASNGYGAVALAGAPTALTIASVVRVTAANGGIAAVTDAGTVNSGEAHFYGAAALRARKFAAPNADVVIAAPFNAVVVTVWDVNGTTHYVNSATPVVAASVAALAGTTFQIMCLSSAGSTVLTGEWLTSGYWERALSSSEATRLLTLLGAKYGVAITP